MSLEYSDDNELIYQAKAVAKDIVNAKYEVTKKVGSFLFLAHSDEEFYQRATTIDEILESTSSRRLASVSDSKAKLVKALYQEWELKHASCDECAPVNFNLPERVASPVLRTDHKHRKLWDKWTALASEKDTEGNSTGRVVRKNFIEDGKNNKTGKPLSPFEKQITKLQVLDNSIGNSLGRADDPEVAKQINDKSVFWADPDGLYGQDKQRISNSMKGRKRGDKPEAADYSDPIDQSKISAAVVTPFADPSSGPNSIMRTYHKCTGNTFQGFDQTTGSFKQCQHEHHEGDGCGLTSEVAPEGSTQPGCGQQHIIGKTMTPSFVNRTGRNVAGVVPNLETEKEKDISGLNPTEKQQHINRMKTTGPTVDDYTSSSDEQVGEWPPSRLFLAHPDQVESWRPTLDADHERAGGEGKHPANLKEFKIGDKTHRVGDIVSTDRRWGSGEPNTEPDLGIVLGASSHRNGEHVRLGRMEGLSTNDENDSSMKGSNPGEYSVIVHRLNSPRTGAQKAKPTGVDPETNQIVPNKVTESTQYYPSSDINTVEPFDSKRFGRGSGGGKTSKLYSRLKELQPTFKTKEAPTRTEKPKTVKPTRQELNIPDIDLSDLF